MLVDPHVGIALDSISNPVISASWDFEPGENTELGREVAAFCRFAFLECLSWSETLRNLMDYLVYGFSLLEATDDVRPIPASRFPSHPGEGFGIVPTGMHPIPPWSVSRWEQSRRNPRQVHAVYQWAAGSQAEQSGERRILADRIVRGTWEQAGANFAGRSILRRAYGPWKIKRTLMVLEAIRHEREHTGIPTITLPQDVTEEEASDAQAMLGALRANEKAFFVLPNGYEFTWNTTNGTTNIGDTIERCNRDIAYNVGATFMLLGGQGTTGSYALASTQRGQYEIGLEKHARFISDAFNVGQDGWSPVRRIVELNYGAAPVPRLIPRNMPTRDWSKILPITHNLTLSGHLTADEETEAFLREVMFLPPRNPRTARARPPVASADPMEVGEE